MTLATRVIPCLDVAGGRQPDDLMDYDGLAIAVHRFDGFSVLLPAL